MLFKRHAYYCIGKYKDAVEAYEKGLSLDPDNATMKSALSTAEQKASELRTDQGPSRGVSHDGGTRGGGGGSGLSGLGNLASLLGGGGGGGGGGGFDIASLMSNPALMNMATQMMQSGALNDIMNNPNVTEM